MKQGKLNGFEIFFILVVIGLLVYSIWRSNTSININNNINLQENNSQEQQHQLNICQMYTQNYATYFAVKQAQCAAVGGTFMCTANQAGCINIPVWDNSMCNTDAQVQVLKSFCSVNSAHWVCDPHNIYCEVLA